MIMTLSQNEFIANLTNLVVVTQINRTVRGDMPDLVRSCYKENIPAGAGKALITVDTLSVEDYKAQSSILTSKLPTVDEQQLNTNVKKYIQVTLNRYLTPGAFANDYAIAEFYAVVLEMLRKTKNIFLYKFCVSAYENFNGGTNNDGSPIALKAGQTLTIDLTDTTGMTGEALAQANTQNAKTIYKEITNLIMNMVAPSRDYNELGFEEMPDYQDIKFIENSKFYNLLNVDALASLLNSAKITDQIKIKETILIPDKQFANADTKTKVIGWIGHEDKFQICPRFEVMTEFFDGSNLNDNHWLHFWLNTGFANGLCLVKVVANFVKPATK